MIVVKEYIPLSCGGQARAAGSDAWSLSNRGLLLSGISGDRRYSSAPKEGEQFGEVLRPLLTGWAGV